MWKTRNVSDISWVYYTEIEFSDWLPDEPAHANRWNCMYIGRKGSRGVGQQYGWADVNCDVEYKFICERHLEVGEKAWAH